MGKQAHDIGVQKRRRQKLERVRIYELRQENIYRSTRPRKVRTDA